jgi:hypothetical protein
MVGSVDMRAHAFLPVVFLALSACATAPSVAPVPAPPAAPPPLFPPTRPPADAELEARVETVRDQVRGILEAQAELLWRAWVDGAPADLGGPLAGKEALFGADTIRTVRRVREGTVDTGRRRALLFLETYLAGEYVARATAAEAARVDTALRAATSSAGGPAFSLAELDARLAAEPDRDRRAALAAAAVPALQRLEAARLAENERVDAAVKALGYRGYADLGLALRQVELEPVAALARKFLDDTRDLHERAFAAAARRELGLAAGELERSDVPRLWKGVGFDAGFPRGRALPALEETLAGLGLPLRDGAIRLDDGAAPRKASRPLCVPVRVPADVRLSVRPAAGPAEWAALFHEAGHAEHFAHAANGTFELDLLGNHVAGEAFAFLFEGLLEDQNWLEAHTDLGGPELAAFRESQATKKLYLLRRYAARALFEIAWRTGQQVDLPPREAWRRRMQEAVGFPLSDEDAYRWALEDDEFFASADHLRAFVLAAQIEERLVKSFGDRWWAQPAAGTYLKSLWAVGNRDRPLELARQVGFPGLDDGALVRRLEDPIVRRPQPPAPAPAPELPAPALPAPAAR